MTKKKKRNICIVKKEASVLNKKNKQEASAVVPSLFMMDNMTPHKTRDNRKK